MYVTMYVCIHIRLLKRCLNQLDKILPAAMMNSCPACPKVMYTCILYYTYGIHTCFGASIILFVDTFESNLDDYVCDIHVTRFAKPSTKFQVFLLRKIYLIVP